MGSIVHARKYYEEAVNTIQSAIALQEDLYLQILLKQCQSLLLFAEEKVSHLLI
jgi:hypothetical protein